MFIVFCIIAFESLLVFFLKDFLQVSFVYPIVTFGVGFIAFIICAILYASGYKAKTKRKKHSSYALTTAVLFVIGILIATMIAVYFNADLSQISQLLSFILIPIAFLLNMLICAAFYHVFSVKDSSSKNA